MMASDAPPPHVLRIIRAAMVFGVLAFGAVVYVTLPSRETTLDADGAALFRLVVFALSATAIVAGWLLRNARAGAASYDRAANLTFIGWALGEAPALAGGVSFFLTGEPFAYTIGLLAFLIVLTMLGIPQPDETGAPPT